MSEETEFVSEHHPAPNDERHQQEYSLMQKIKNDLGDAIIDDGTYVHLQPRRLFIQVRPDRLRDVIKYMQETHDMWQFSTLSGRDLGDDLQAVYHFFLTETKVGISFRVNVPRSKPEYSSITDLVPAAEYVENELRELFGVITAGHPYVRRVELPENWPKNEYPMRKDWADPRGLMERSKTLGAKAVEDL
ncbi:MAG: NADH-quinone oxidoreductase subunit C [Candidatus Thorarchaeota archaeon]|nr:NADH-quinone oxidoreductase subunit C [Candidatus Thorarchaeota archaeon]